MRQKKMKTRRLASFGSTFLLSLSSLLIFASPKALAAGNSITTAINWTANHPFITLFVTFAAAAGIAFIAHRYNKV